jgi:hypothetical protein
MTPPANPSCSAFGIFFGASRRAARHVLLHMAKFRDSQPYALLAAALIAAAGS